MAEHDVAQTRHDHAAVAQAALQASEQRPELPLLLLAACQRGRRVAHAIEYGFTEFRLSDLPDVIR